MFQNHLPSQGYVLGHVQDNVVPLAAPVRVDQQGSAMLPANDANSAQPYFMAADSGVTPFDNGTTDYRYIAYSWLSGTGLRVTYSNTRTGSFVNEVAVTGATGTPANPVLSIDLKGVRDSGGKTATKQLWYINTAVASSAAGRLRVATVDNDNNKTLSGDAAVDLTNILAASGWNKNLISIHYAKVDLGLSSDVSTGNPERNRYFLLGVFSDDTNSYIGCIFGDTVSTLQSQKISVITNFPSKSAIGPSAIVPLVGDYNRLQSIRGIGYLFAISNSPATITTPTSVSLAVCQGSLQYVREVGNSFLGLNADAVTAKVWGRAFYYDATAESPFNVLFEGDDTISSSQWASFTGLGSDALQSGEANYI